ncbi:mitochondrial 37S ribosomal protein nam9, partial [Globomyces sp. JEL0801]
SLYPARRLEDGDIITVSPHVIPTLKSPKTKKDRKDKALTFNKIVALRLKQVKEKHMELEAKGLNRAATEENQTKERKQTEQKKPEENQDETVKWTKSADAKVSDATKENDTSKELSDGANEQKEPVDESSFDEKKEKAKIVADLLKEEPKNDLKGKHFNYIPYMSPWMFIPTYLEVDYATCSTVFLRSPLPQPKRMEIPSPYGPTYHLLAYEWYSSIKKSQTKTPLLPQIVISGQAVKLKPKFDQMVRRERKNRQSKDKAVEKEIEDLQLQSLKLKYQARSFLDEKYLTSNGPKNEKLIQDIITITSPSQL